MPKKYRRNGPIIPHIHHALAQFVKDELRKQSMSYSEFAKKFARFDKRETEASIRCKLSRGTYSALFLILALDILKIGGIERWRIMNPAIKATAKNGKLIRKTHREHSKSANPADQSDPDDWSSMSHSSNLSSGSIGGWVRPKRPAS